MRKRLSDADRHELQQLLMTQLGLESVITARTFLQYALSDKPQYLRTLMLDGTIEERARDILIRLEEPSEDESEKKPLSRIIDYMISVSANIDYVRNLSLQWLRTRNLWLWGKNVQAQEMSVRVGLSGSLESIIAKQDFVDIPMLVGMLDAIPAIVKIEGSSPLGVSQSASGFMVSDTLLMTNHHVFASMEQSSRNRVVFNYQIDIHGNPEDTKPAQILANADMFYTNPELDFTIAAVQNPPHSFKPLKPDPTLPNETDQAIIIQHPQGGFKQIAIDHIEKVIENFLCYSVDTEQGSSGSPVLNRTLGVIGIHARGVDKFGNCPNLNTGFQMRAIMDDIQRNAPTIFRAIGG